MSVASKTAKLVRNDKRKLILDQFTPYRIAVLSHAISERLANAYANENITIPEWRVLAGVAQASALAARDVVHMTPMDKMTVSRAVASLENKGFVVRATSTSDRRVAMLSLSDDGRTLFEKIAEMALAFEDTLLSGLSVKQREDFIEIIQQLEKCALETSAEDRAGAETEPDG